MKDGPLRRAIKRAALAHFQANLSVYRAFERWRGRVPYELGGDCRRCARCCEAPGIQVGWAIWYLPTLRRLFLWWQKQINGFELVERNSRHRVFIFRCAHFDRATRSCDSYNSRPGMCRDYPRILLHQASPQFLPGCGYRAVARNAQGMLRVLDQAGLTPEQITTLKKGLHLER